MATAVSNYLAAKILNSVLRHQSFPLEAAYFALHTASPGSIGDPTTEVVGGSYARQHAIKTNWTTPSVLSIAYNNSVVWQNLPSVTLTHISLWTLSSGGNMLFWGPLAAHVTVSSGDSYILDANDFAISLSS